MAGVPFRHLTVDARAISHLYDPVDDLDARRLQQRLSPDRRRTGRSHAGSADARHPLSAARQRRSFLAAIIVALPLVLPLVYFMMKRMSK
jgi:hypothetical protein